MRRGRVWAWIALGATLALTQAASAAPVAAKPFKYTYRVTALTINAEYRAHNSTATSHLWLDGPSKMRWLSWFGPKPMGGTPTTISVAALYLNGEAAYSSPVPDCSSKFTYRSSRSKPVTSALTFDNVTSRTARIRVEVGQFPIARALPGEDGGLAGSGRRCGYAEVRWYDNANTIVPISVMTKPRFVAVATRRERFEDSESIEWTMKLTVTRLRYHLIDCPTESGC